MNKFFLLILILILPLCEICAQKHDPLEGSRKVENKRERIRNKSERQEKKLYRPIKRIENKEQKIYQAYLKENRARHLNNQDLKTRERIETHLKETEKYYQKERIRLVINRLKNTIHGKR